jgi:prephenate dehydratase
MPTLQRAVSPGSDIAFTMSGAVSPDRRAFAAERCKPGMQTLTLGPAGTYSHRAARAIADGDIVFTESVTDIIESVSEGHHDRGVVPVENSIEGSVTEALDAFTEYEVAVVREIITPIRHALLAQSETFETVASHAQALAQCRSYLEERYPEATLESVTSTARGVERAREDPTVAAIGHPANADTEDRANGGSTEGNGETGDGLLVLGEDIQDRSSNATRFLVVAPPDERTSAGSKTTFIVYPSVDYPGLLLRMLEPFADRDINLTRVESRPSGERLGDYVFHIDIAAGLYEQRTQDALAAVEEIAADGWVRRLGSYDSETVL